MMIDLNKMIVFIWMVLISYMAYIISKDIHYLTKLVHAYISMAMEISRH